MKLNPDTVIPGHDHARLTRFVDTLPSDVLCEVDREANICRVNRALYDSLPRHQQRMVFATTVSLKVEAPQAANDRLAGVFREAV